MQKFNVFKLKFAILMNALSVIILLGGWSYGKHGN